MGYERNPLVSGVEFVHMAERCMVEPGAEACCIHDPSDHPLSNARLHWRTDLGLMERICQHGVGHPDPDDLAFKRMHQGAEEFERFAWGAHGCDGCCR